MYCVPKQWGKKQLIKSTCSLAWIESVSLRRFLTIMHHYDKVSCEVNYHANIKYCKRKNAQPDASCQLAWTMLCCITWTLLTSLLTNYSIVQLSILVTQLSNNENNSEQPWFFQYCFSCSNNRKQPLFLNQCRTTLFNQQWCKNVCYF